VTALDASQADFEQKVLERSRELPVVVDFWAEWCAPCRALTPALEQAVAKREGAVELVKVDVDANPDLAARYRVQGIPAVKAFRDGDVATEFTGALPPAEIERFLDVLVPSEAEQLAEEGAEAGDEQALRRALELDPSQSAAAVALARLLLQRGDTEEALRVAEPAAAADFAASGLAARAELELGDDPPEDAFRAWDDGNHERALELLQEELGAAADDARRDLLRRVMVAIFTELGADDPLAREHRRRLAASMY
jgi:putative thioredoxin